MIPPIGFSHIFKTGRTFVTFKYLNKCKMLNQLIVVPEHFICIYGNLKKHSILVLGSEKEGVSKKILQVSDEIIKIPTSGEIISLNVSVAAGIILTELKRQRI